MRDQQKNKFWLWERDGVNSIHIRIELTTREKIDKANWSLNRNVRINCSCQRVCHVAITPDLLMIMWSEGFSEIFNHKFSTKKCFTSRPAHLLISKTLNVRGVDGYHMTSSFLCVAHKCYIFYMECSIQCELNVSIVAQCTFPKLDFYVNHR